MSQRVRRFWTIYPWTYALTGLIAAVIVYYIGSLLSLPEDVYSSAAIIVILAWFSMAVYMTFTSRKG